MRGLFQNTLLNIVFPKFCLNCKKEGDYLCQDCQGLTGILEYRFCLCEKASRLIKEEKCNRCRRNRRLDGLYFALPYQNAIVKNLIRQFKYEPFAQELADTITSLIINHFQLLGKEMKNFSEFLLIPVPLTRRRLRWRGFNQAEEISKKLAGFLDASLTNNVLMKIKETQHQVDLSGKDRWENVKGVFAVSNREKIKNKNILLMDDVYTTGATMEECAKSLKENGARSVWGIVAARG